MAVLVCLQSQGSGEVLNSRYQTGQLVDINFFLIQHLVVQHNRDDDFSDFILMTHLLEILNIMRKKYFLVIPFLHYRCRAFIVIILKRFLEKLLYTKKV